MGAVNNKVDFRMSALMGIVDIVASTEVTNALDLFSAFELQRDFHAAALTRARANGVQIINSTGDGFLFIVNEKKHWQDCLMSFVQGVLSDFQCLLKGIERAKGRRLASGLRFGVSRGSVIISCDGVSGQGSAVGPAINLAARLCARAGANELVISQNVWEDTPASFDGEITAVRTYTDLKGFNASVEAIHKQISF
jgi:class 3 adenylate cyclase